MLAERGADRAGQMWTPFAPVEAWPAQHAAFFLAVLVEIDAEPLQQHHPGIRYDTGIDVEFDLAMQDHGICQRDAKMPGEMVVAGAPSAQRCFAWTGEDFSLPRRGLGGDLHDAFHHARDGGRGEPVVSVASLFFN